MSETDERVDIPADVAEELLRLLDEPDPLAAFVASEVPATEPDPTAIRELLEAWAELPAALEPHPPSAATRARLLAQARAASPWDVPPPVGMGTTAERGRDVEGGLRRGHPSWLLPLAATLMIGLMGMSGWLWSRLDEQSRRVEALQQRVAELSESRSTPAAQARLAAMEEHLRIVSTPGVEVCPLRLRANGGQRAAVRGILYVASDHQHWYLAVSGLPPAPEGQAYHLWFFVGDRPVGAGAFAARPGEIVRLGSDTMPDGTDAVGITLEPSEQVEEPSQEPILFGDEIMRVV